MASLGNLTQLTQLSLSAPGVTDIPSALIAELRELPQLLNLQLRDVGLGPAACGDLAAVLARTSALTTLDLSRNFLGLSGWYALADRGLPASLVTLDVRQTFHTDNDPVSTSITGPTAGNGGAAPSLVVLAKALRACSRLQQLSVGPQQRDLWPFRLRGPGRWEALCIQLPTLSALGGAGAVPPLVELTALTTLTWFWRPDHGPGSDEGTPEGLSRLSGLRALQLTYEANDYGSPSAVDPHYAAVLGAVAALTALTALNVRLDMWGHFSDEEELSSIVGRLRACTELRELALHLADGEPRRADTVSDRPLAALAGLTSLRVFSLQISGAAAEQAASFQLSAGEGLSFAPESLQDLTLQVALVHDAGASYEAALPCTHLTALRLGPSDPLDLGGAGMLPRAAEALAYRMGALHRLVVLQLEDELHGPHAQAALEALPRMTALEVLSVRSCAPAFPMRVVAALQGRTALRQLTILHDRWVAYSDTGQIYTACEVLAGLVHFSRLQRVGLCDMTAAGAYVQIADWRLAQVMVRSLSLQLVVAGFDRSLWARAEALAGRKVSLFGDCSAGRASVGVGHWGI